MKLKKFVFILAILVPFTLILSGCSERFDDYSNDKLFYLETIGWESSMEDVLRLNSKSNNIRGYLNVRGLERETDHMIFQNIIYNGIKGYVSYNFYNDNKLYKVEYALLENKGDEKYGNNPRYLSEDNSEIRILWNTQDTNISLIARQNGLAGERRDLIVRYYRINK